MIALLIVGGVVAWGLLACRARARADRMAARHVLELEASQRPGG